MPQEVRPPGSNWLRIMIKSILLGQILVVESLCQNAPCWPVLQTVYLARWNHQNRWVG